MTRILILGKDGQLGRELVSLSQRLGNVHACGRTDCDLADPEMTAGMIRRIQPDWILNAAAYTNVDQAETNPEAAYAVNAGALGVIAEEGKKIGAKVIHYSTDYVFSGDRSSPYVENDPTGALGVYGSSKLGGEKALRESGIPSLIFRVAWLYGLGGKNFVRTILRAAMTNKELKVVNDQVGSPTWSRAVATATVEVLTQLLAREKQGEVLEQCSIYNMAAAGQATWNELARCAVDDFRCRWGNQVPLAVERIVDISTKEYGAPAPRPAWSVLSTEKLRGTFGVQIPHWRPMLASFFDSVHDPALLLK
jgi:dTDP-4-dehydrorhamnose reductase